MSLMSSRAILGDRIRAVRGNHEDRSTIDHWNGDSPVSGAWWKWDMEEEVYLYTRADMKTGDEPENTANDFGLLCDAVTAAVRCLPLAIIHSSGAGQGQLEFACELNKETKGER